MTTFKEFLQEGLNGPNFSGSSANTPFESTLSFVEWVEKHCSGYLAKAKHAPIFRGMPSPFLTSHIDTNKFHRTTANSAHNYYTLWMDNHDSWKNYPKRSKSFICSTDADYAGRFGALHLMIPTDDCRIGICSGPDLWQSFPAIEGTVFGGYDDDLDAFMSYLFDFISSSAVIGNPETNFKDLYANLAKITPALIKSVPKNEPISTKIVDALFIGAMQKHRCSNLAELVTLILDPDRNKFVAVEHASSIPNLASDVEVWAQGKIASLNLSLLSSMSETDIEIIETFLKKYNLDTLVGSS